MDVSIIASSVRPHLYDEFFKSLQGTSVEYEVVFAGNNCGEIKIQGPFGDGFICNIEKLKYVFTNNIKPAQCYEIARRHASGEVVVWAADDCRFPNDVIGDAFRFWKSLDDRKAILSMLTHERYEKSFFITNLDNHRLCGPRTPLMAPIGMMSREYLQELGGFDRRYICGQYENDVVMRVLSDGGQVVKYEQKPVIIDHYTGHGGVSTVEGYARPFAKGYPHDRKILEGSWLILGAARKHRADELEPYSDTDILTKSQSYNMPGIWND